MIFDSDREAAGSDVPTGVGRGTGDEIRAFGKRRAARRHANVGDAGAIVRGAGAECHIAAASAERCVDHHVAGASDRRQFGVVDRDREGAGVGVARRVGSRAGHDGDALAEATTRAPARVLLLFSNHCYIPDYKLPPTKERFLAEIQRRVRIVERVADPFLKQAKAECIREYQNAAHDANSHYTTR